MTKAKTLPSSEELQKSFEYKDGHLYKNGRKTGHAVRRKIDGRQYMFVSYYPWGKSYPAHRLIWVWHGYSLKEDELIDHIDGNSINNRIENLRACTNKQNQENKKSCYSTNKTSGHLGVRWHKGTNKWVAYIHHNGQGYHLGVFVNIEDAIAARVAAEKKYYTHAPDRE
jgi:hypothetical protein